MPSRDLSYPVFDADNHLYELGSDWPHPEGLADPINLVGDLETMGLDDEGIRKIMGGNLVDLFKVPDKKVFKPDAPALVPA